MRRITWLHNANLWNFTYDLRNGRRNSDFWINWENRERSPKMESCQVTSTCQAWTIWIVAKTYSRTREWMWRTKVERWPNFEYVNSVSLFSPPPPLHLLSIVHDFSNCQSHSQPIHISISSPFELTLSIRPLPNSTGSGSPLVRFAGHAHNSPQSLSERSVANFSIHKAVVHQWKWSSDRWDNWRISVWLPVRSAYA